MEAVPENILEERFHLYFHLIPFTLSFRDIEVELSCERSNYHA